MVGGDPRQLLNRADSITLGFTYLSCTVVWNITIRSVLLRKTRRILCATWTAVCVWCRCVPSGRGCGGSRSILLSSSRILLMLCLKSLRSSFYESGFDRASYISGEYWSRIK
jgi:hypothetical protein